MGEENPPSVSKLCVDQCKHKTTRQQTQTMIRCCLCATWFHIECVGLAEDEAVGVWPCITCRLMPQQIISIQKNMASLLDNNKTILAKFDQLTSSLQEKSDECKKLQDEKADLLKKVSDLNEQLNRRTWMSFRNKPTLLVGDSILRDIDENKLAKTCVISKSEATTKDIADIIQQDDNDYSSVIICAGSNDSKKEPFDLDIITSNFKDIIEKATNNVATAAAVKICSIPPRTDDAGCQEKIDQINKSLEQLATSTGATFVSNDSSFKLNDGEINDGYLLNDGHHLNRSGCNRLVKNLKLVPKSGHEKDVTKSRNSYKSNRSSTVNAYQPRREPKDTKHQWSKNGCSNCGEYNHSTSRCRWGEPIVCHECNSAGHKKKFCTRNKSY